MALFWLSDEAWAAIEPHLPKNQPGARRVDDRRVISGIFHMLKSGGRWCDCPADYGPATTVYNRFNRWSARGFWLRLLDALVDAGAVTKSTAIDSTYVKAQRAAFGGKKGAKAQAIGRSRGGWTTKIHALTDVVGRPFALMLTPGNVADVTAAPELLARMGRARYVLGDKGYDADPLRRALRQAGAVPVIPGRSSRKRKVRYDHERYKGRHLIENAFCRLKDFRRVATRYDKLAANFLSGVALATALAFWL
ncbi:MAG TPA: IS5 family transposase [Sphingomonas sp.]